MRKLKQAVRIKLFGNRGSERNLSLLAQVPHELESLGAPG